MAKAIIAPSNNDGGIILVLFLLAASIACAVFSAVLYCEKHTTTDGNRNPARPLRLLVGSAGIGNGVVHIFLLLYIMANEGNTSEYWLEERKLGGIEGPAFLVVLNLVAGFVAVEGYSMTFPIVWNSFVAVAGTMMPVVWPRFLAQGLDAWPYTIIFLWFGIFTMELTAVTASLSYYVVNSKLKRD